MSKLASSLGVGIVAVGMLAVPDWIAFLFGFVFKLLWLAFTKGWSLA